MVKKIESNTILESQPRVPGGFFVDYDIIQKGILDGKKAYKGPNFVQIDLTNNCNNNCVGCWCHSFLLGDLMLKGEEKKKFIPFDLIKKTIDNLASLGTYEVLLAGSGEPFMHPDIMKILEYIKKKNIKINLITNFSLLDKKKVKKIVKLGIDFITISLWAGTLETYLKTHPNSTRKTFENIKKNLIYLNSLKKNSKPQVKIYNVISNLNYLEIEKMVDFAVETSSDFVEFTLIDIIPNKTDCLLLSDSQKKEVIRQFPNLKLKYNYFSKLKYPLFKSSKLNFISMFKLLKEVTRNSVSMFGKDKDIDSELESFGVFVRDPVLPKGFSYDGKNVKCPRGRLNDVTYLEEGGDSCVVFEFYSLKNEEFNFADTSWKIDFTELYNLLKDITKKLAGKGAVSNLKSFKVFVRAPVLPKGFSYDGKNVKCPKGRLNDVLCLKKDENHVIFEFYNLKKKGMHNCFECPDKLTCVLKKCDFKIKLKLAKPSLSTCFECSDKSTCILNKHDFKIKLRNITHLLGYGSLYRRLASSKKYQEYDLLIDKVPCYVGWLYSRILTNGDVIPCCKAHKKPLGNIYEKSFYEIWNSKKYEKFRYNAKNLKKSDDYFEGISCYKSCDNIGMNLSLMRLISQSEKK